MEIKDLSSAEAVERELLLATVHLGPGSRGPVLPLVGSSGASVIDSTRRQVTVALSGAPTIDAFEAESRGYEQVDIQRTGRVALPRPAPRPDRPRTLEPNHSKEYPEMATLYYQQDADPSLSGGARSRSWATAPRATPTR